MTILISSAGRRVELIRCFQQSANTLGLNLRVLAADAEPSLSSACQIADGHFKVPSVKHQEFASQLLQICDKHRVNLVVPTIDTELETFGDHQREFRAVGTRVIISSRSVIRMAGNKAATAEFLRSNELPVSKTGSIAELLATPDLWRWPVVLKPVCGSASLGVCVIDNLQEAKFAATKRDDYLAQELVRGSEYTVNLFFDERGRMRAAVPHERREVRAGEVSKGITSREPRLVQLAWRLGSVLKGAVGSLCFQAIVPDNSEPAIFEINARFGGGYPLAHRAGATFTQWLLEEAGGLPSSASDDWQEGVAMLRYDAAVFHQIAAK